MNIYERQRIQAYFTSKLEINVLSIKEFQRFAGVNSILKNAENITYIAVVHDQRLRIFQ